VLLAVCKRARGPRRTLARAEKAPRGGQAARLASFAPAPAPAMQCSRSSLHTLHALSRALPAARAPVPSSSSAAIALHQVRHASWSLPSIRNLLPRKLQRATAAEDGTEAAQAAQEGAASKKDVFEQAIEDEDVALSQARSGLTFEREVKQATFVRPLPLLSCPCAHQLTSLPPPPPPPPPRAPPLPALAPPAARPCAHSPHAQHKSSTANFKTSRRKLNDLSRLVAGRTADEAILQLQVRRRALPFAGDACESACSELEQRRAPNVARALLLTDRPCDLQPAPREPHADSPPSPPFPSLRVHSPQASQKKQAPRLLSMLALARDHAMAKGLRREELVVGASSLSLSSALCPVLRALDKAGA